MLLGDFIKTYRHPSDNQYHSPVINGIVDFAQSKVSWFYNVYTYVYTCGCMVMMLRDNNTGIEPALSLVYIR